MTDKQKLAKAIKLIKMLEKDAELALDGAWDKSDSGFEAQLVVISAFFREINKEEKGPLKQIKMPI